MSTNVATPSSEGSTPATATPTVTVLPLPNGNSGNFTMDPPTGNNSNPTYIPGVNGLGSVSAGARSVYPAFGFGPLFRWMREGKLALLPFLPNHICLGLQRDRHKFETTQSLPLDCAYGDTTSLWETLNKIRRANWDNAFGFERIQMTLASFFLNTLFGLSSVALRLALPLLPYIFVQQIL
jgi:hypothetical protein